MHNFLKKKLILINTIYQQGRKNKLSLFDYEHFSNFFSLAQNTLHIPADRLVMTKFLLHVMNMIWYLFIQGFVYSIINFLLLFNKKNFNGITLHNNKGVLNLTILNCNNVRILDEKKLFIFWNLLNNYYYVLLLIIF